jgi:ubiquinone/menaquinone biosynthesis C-methylase UbiE
LTNPAESYESYMVPALFAPWAEYLVQTLNPRPGERVLDVACGTGIVARQAATDVGAAGRVVGLDLNPLMLEVARATAAREGLSIEFCDGRAEALPFPDAGFDVVFCQFALMFVTDRPAALREMFRVLASGGRLGLSVWQGIEKHPFYATLDEVIQRRFGISALASIFALGDAAALRALLVAAGFQRIELDPATIVARFPNPAGFLQGEIELDTAAIPEMQHLDDAARSEITAAISEEMQASLREVTRGDHVEIPFHAYVARARVPT